jgi:hypothetical protein
VLEAFVSVGERQTNTGHATRSRRAQELDLEGL